MAKKKPTKFRSIIQACSVKECPYHGQVVRGFCPKHYTRWSRHRSPLVTHRDRGNGDTMQDRFWSRIDKTPGQGPNGDCWQWRAAAGKEIYAQVKIAKQRRVVHHVAWFLKFGQWPTLWILHSCDNPPCCNPQHLREGTAKDNANDRSIRNRGVKGESHPNAKYKETDIRHAYNLLKTGLRTSVVAQITGIHRVTISSLRHGRAWKEVSGE